MPARNIIVDQKGSILLFSLIILSVLLASGLVLSSIILRSLKSTQQTRNGFQAWYAATSGVEYALSSLRHNRAIPDDLDGEEIELEANARFSLSLSKQEQVEMGRIKKNNSAYVDIFNPNEELEGTEIRRLRLMGEGEAGTWVEVRWVGWTDDGAWVRNNSEVIFSAAELGGQGRVVDLTHGLGFIDEDIPAGGLFEPRAWRVQIIALYGDIERLEVTGENQNGDQVDIPAHLQVRSLGSFRDSRQTVTAAFPFQTPLSDIFNFVLFSEERVIK